MSDNLEAIIEAYNKNIIYSERQLRKDKWEFEYYFDCVDILNTTIGYKLFFSPDFQVDIYKKISSILYGLLIGGWLGEVHLLPLHQGEFFDKLSYNFNIENPTITLDMQEKFIRHVEHTDNRVNFGHLWKLTSDRERIEFFENTIDCSNQYFKVIYTLYKLSWKSRLIELNKKRALVIKDFDYDVIIRLSKSTLFKQLKAAFDTDSKRAKDKNKTNNFNDALSLCYLNYLKSSNPSKIPILLDSSGTFLRIIEQAELTSEFTYYNRILQKDVPMIRDTSYFILKAIFDPPESKLENIKKEMPDYYSKAVTEEVETVKEIFNHQSPQELSTAIKRIIDENEAAFGKYVKYKFFRNVWLPGFADTDIYTLISEKIRSQSKENLIDDVIEDKFIKDYFDKYDELILHGKRVNTLAKVQVFLSKLNDKNSFDKYLTYNEDTQLYASLHYGIFRFSMPHKQNGKYDMQDYDVQLRNIISSRGLLSENQSDRSIAIDKVITNLANGLFSPKDRHGLFSKAADANCLSIALGVLWCLNDNYHIDLILSEFEEKKQYPHYSFALMHCAAIIQHNKNYAEVLERIAAIRNCITGKATTPSYRLQSCLSYIEYLQWSKKYTDNFSATKRHPKNMNDRSLYEAVTLSEMVLGYLDCKKEQGKALEKEAHKIFYLYAYNMKIYIITEWYSEKDIFDSLEDMIHTFRGLKSSWNYIWQGRFDDTISRYYLRQAVYYLEEQNIKEFRQGVKIAKGYMENALEDSSPSETEKKKSFEEVIRYFDKSTDDYLMKVYSAKK